jgi:hypothetical protein
MGGAPAIETVRAGVQFTPAAAAAFRRLEARLGRRVDVNSTYRDWDTQMGMYLAWNRYVNSGYKASLKPPHSRAIHPSISIHCQGNAIDSDDWRTPGFNALAAEYGFIRTAAGDPTEQHHFEYQSWNDRHRNEGVPAVVRPATVAVPKKRKKRMGIVIRRRDHASKHTYYLEGGFIKHLSSNDEVNAMLWALDDTTRQFDEGDFMRATYGFGLGQYEQKDFDYIAGDRGGRAGGYLVATWRDAGKIPR